MASGASELFLVVPASITWPVVVNALYSIWQHSPAGGVGSIKPQFFLGIVLAALGGCLVTYYKPNPPVAKPATKVTAMAPELPTRK